MRRKGDFKNLDVRDGGIIWLNKTIKGQRHRFSLETRDPIEARKRRDKYLADVAHGRFKPEPTHTFNELLVMFIDDHMPTLKPRSQQRYATSATHLIEAFDGLVLSEITPALMKQFENQRRAQGVSNSTIRRDFACLSSMFSLAEEEEWISGNPVRPFLRQRGKRGLTEGQPHTRWLTIEEEALVLKNAPSDRFRQLVGFAIDTGFRRSEQFRALKSHVDTDRGMILVPADHAKSGRERWVPLWPRALTLCQAILEAGGESPFLFSRPTGEPYATNSPWIWETLQKACRKSEIAPTSWHDLRRTCGCRLLQNHGFQMHQVRDWLGHSSVTVTERSYAFLGADELRRQADSAVTELERVRNDRSRNPRITTNQKAPR